MEFDKEKLRAICPQYGIDLVVLFGSAARGDVGRESDLDIAVHLERHDGDCDRLDLIDALERLFGRTVDLVIHNTIGSDTLRHEIFKHGRALYDKTGTRFTELQVDAFLRYGDSEYLRRIKAKALDAYLEGLDVTGGRPPQD